MTRAVLALCATLAVAACGEGTNPLTDPPHPGPENPGTGEDTSPGAIYGFGLEPDLSMNSLRYDAAADEIVINNIPFDGPDGRYGRAGTLPNGFGRYESQQTLTTGRRQYFAVFRRSDSGFAQAGAVASPDYRSFGFGGVTAQRTTARVRLPGEGEYVYTGEYAAVRVFDLSQAGGVDEAQHITGRVQLDVDVEDFDVVGAVEGIISDRMLFAADGTPLGVLDDYIALATAEIDFANATIRPSAASGISFADSQVITEGDWAGVFAGPNGEEVAGIVILTGTVSPDPDSGTVRETGVFIAIRNEGEGG
jgi:hypothetical protein